MITNQVLANQGKSGNGKEPINKQRRILKGGCAGRSAGIASVNNGR
jgi:hypothetical protein